MKRLILGCVCLLIVPIISSAGTTSSLPFKELTAIVDYGEKYGEVKVIAECSSTKESITRKFTKLVVKTKDKDFAAPESMLAPFSNPGEFRIHGGVTEDEINFIFEYEKKPKSFTEGRIRFKNGKFNVW